MVSTLHSFDFRVCGSRRPREFIDNDLNAEDNMALQTCEIIANLLFVMRHFVENNQCAKSKPFDARRMNFRLTYVQVRALERN